jgi:hypothetical protein
LNCLNVHELFWMLFILLVIHSAETYS